MFCRNILMCADTEINLKKTYGRESNLKIQQQSYICEKSKGILYKYKKREYITTLQKLGVYLYNLVKPQ